MEILKDNNKLTLEFNDIETIDKEYSINAIKYANTKFKIEEICIAGKDFMNIDNIKELHSFIKYIKSNFKNLIITVKTNETFDKLAAMNNYFILDTLANIDYLEDRRAIIDLKSTKKNKEITYLDNKKTTIKEETVEEKPKRKRGRPRKNTTKESK